MPSKVRQLAVIGTHARDTPIGGYSDVPKPCRQRARRPCRRRARGASQSIMRKACGHRKPLLVCDEVKLAAGIGEPQADRRSGAGSAQGRHHRDGPRRQRTDQPRGLGRYPPRRPLVARPHRPAGRPRPSDPRAPQADGGRAPQRPPAGGELSGGSGPRADRRMVPRPGDRSRGRRRPVRKGQPGRQASGHDRRARSDSFRFITITSRPPAAAICSVPPRRFTRSASGSVTPPSKSPLRGS